jgi:hypothetical protein
MPKRQGRPVKDFRPQKDRAKPKGGIPLDELLTGAHAACRCWQRRKTASIAGELSLRGRIGPASICGERQICDDAVERGESTDRTNGDRTDSSPGRHALFRR